MHDESLLHLKERVTSRGLRGVILHGYALKRWVLEFEMVIHDRSRALGSSQGIIYHRGRVEVYRRTCNG